MDRNQQTPQQIRTYLNDASPDDVVELGKAVLARIGQLDQTHQKRFTDLVRNDPQANRLFEQIEA